MTSRGRPFTIALAATAAIVLAACSGPPKEHEGPVDFGTPQEYAQQLFDGVNAEREAAGLGQLEWSDCLAQAAVARAIATLPEDDLTHAPLATLCTEDVAIGENLSRGAFTAPEIVELWMDSAGHRANIEREGFTDAGVGCVAYSFEYPTSEANPGEEIGGYACSLLFEGGE